MRNLATSRACAVFEQQRFDLAASNNISLTCSGEKSIRYVRALERNASVSFPKENVFVRIIIFPVNTKERRMTRSEVLPQEIFRLIPEPVLGQVADCRIDMAIGSPQSPEQSSMAMIESEFSANTLQRCKGVEYDPSGQYLSFKLSKAS